MGSSIALSGVIEDAPLSSLRPHPEHALLFPPQDLAWLMKSLRRVGQMECIVAKADGTVLDGHLRLLALLQMGAATAEVRRIDVGAYHDEVFFMVHANCERRQLTPRQVKHCYATAKAALRRGRG